MKAFMLSLKITYRGKSIVSCPLWHFVLVTDKGWAYDVSGPWDMEYITPENVTNEVRENAIKINCLPTGRSLAPNTYREGDILFQFPADEGLSR